MLVPSSQMVQARSFPRVMDLVVCHGQPPQASDLRTPLLTSSRAIILLNKRSCYLSIQLGSNSSHTSLQNKFSLPNCEPLCHPQRRPCVPSSTWQRAALEQAFLSSLHPTQVVRKLIVHSAPLPAALQTRILGSVRCSASMV